MRYTALVLAIFAPMIALVPACGGAAPHAAPAEAPPSAFGYGDSGKSQPQQAPGYPPGAPTTPAAPESQATTTPTGASREATLGRARSDLDAAQRELDVAASDCAAACRALGSMDRATLHLCGLAQVDDERMRCEDAKTKVRGARDKVRTTCGSCPGGVTVDRNAPVPSPR
jgi:hypothetical protein